MHTLSGARRTRRVLSMTVTMTAAVLSACGTGSGDAGTKQETAGVKAGAAGSAPPVAGVARATPEVPKLPRKIEDISADEFIDVIKDVAWRGHLVKRECDEPGCDAAGTRATWVRHEAAAGANDLAFDTISVNGVVVGRMQNIGRFKERFYQLPAGRGEW